jgi:ATPase subunit of ABC transporter with duplicated ATPase domains
MLKLSLSDVRLKHARAHISFEVAKGESCALVGPNGVGKSSLINYIKIHQKKLLGKIDTSFFDQPPLSPLGDLRGIDMLTLLSELYPERVRFDELGDYELVDQLNFRSLLKRPIWALSGGENQMLKLIVSFYLKSDIYFLDEPSNFLDKNRLKTLVDILKEQMSHENSFVIIDHDDRFLRDCCNFFIPLKVRAKGEISASEKISKSELSSGFFNYRDWSGESYGF